jgi:hypothetical protein
MKHPTDIEGNRSLEDLANELKDLRYDSLADYLKQLSKGIKNDANADRGRKRYQLAACLYHAAYHIKQASRYITKAWKICEPYMKEK